MSDEKGDPRSVRHLRPQTVSQPPVMPVDPTGPDDVISQDEIDDIDSALRELQKPFAPEEVEKLPKPMWKNAWKDDNGRDLRKGKCDECGGYHCLSNTIHLDYIGHAGVTRRLLEVDPLWDWEPLAMDEDGLPRFDRFGGLWIRLRVCGVTRLGYGDAAGKSPGTTAVKEIIGDAIRNAAMRFGVALDLWSKLDRHEGKNPGATEETQGQQRVSANSSGDQNSRGSSRANGGQGRVSRSGGTANVSQAVKDALDSVTSICDEHGYSYQYANDRFESDYGIKPTEATAEQLLAFGAVLIEEATAEPDGDAVAGTGDVASGDGAVADDDPYTDAAPAVDPDKPLF